uniref:F-box associated domain-containing protein n=2 Tax=Triticum urartu TaxID=4572 RepID=A0A8R7UY57_TRIUA
MVGSDQPRSIQWPTVPEQRFIPDNWFYHCRAVHHRGSLHWAMGLNITVFDTIAETFRQMSRPTQLGDMVSLMDMGGALALCRTSSECVTTLEDVWVLQDYDAETWGFLYQINLSVMEASLPLDLQIKYVRSMAVMNERELLVQNRRSRILHCDIDGVFLENVESEEHENHWTLSWHRLQESMISLPLFETQKQEAVNKEPLFSIVL